MRGRVRGVVEGAGSRRGRRGKQGVGAGEGGRVEGHWSVDCVKYNNNQYQYLHVMRYDNNGGWW